MNDISELPELGWDFDRLEERGWSTSKLLQLRA